MPRAQDAHDCKDAGGRATQEQLPRSGASQIAHRLEVFPAKCTTNPVCRGRRDAQNDQARDDRAEDDSAQDTKAGLDDGV